MSGPGTAPVVDFLRENRPWRPPGASRSIGHHVGYHLDAVTVGVCQQLRHFAGTAPQPWSVESKMRDHHRDARTAADLDLYVERVEDPRIRVDTYMRRADPAVLRHYFAKRHPFFGWCR